MKFSRENLKEVIENDEVVYLENEEDFGKEYFENLISTYMDNFLFNYC